MSGRSGKRTSRRGFDRVAVQDLPQGRQGKHHELTGEIAREMAALADGQAIRLPLKEIGLSLPNLRSAVTRAMSSRGVKISTFSDGKNLFVWKKTADTAPYERKSRRSR
jgi:hypothetical protein